MSAREKHGEVTKEVTVAYKQDEATKGSSLEALGADGNGDLGGYAVTSTEGSARGFVAGARLRLRLLWAQTMVRVLPVAIRLDLLLVLLYRWFIALASAGLAAGSYCLERWMFSNLPHSWFMGLLETILLAVVVTVGLAGVVIFALAPVAFLQTLAQGRRKKPD